MTPQIRPALARLAVLLLAGPQLVPAVPAAKPVSEFLQTCRILGSLRQGNLTVVAVRGGFPAAATPMATLDEMMPGGKISITETANGGSVNTLVLSNHGDRPVFIMAGEILAGAKQDRILQQDVILPSGGTSVQVPAFCVEHGRWREQSSAFYTEKAAAPVAVRRAAQASKNQAVVWEEVASNNAAVSVSAPTGTLSATYKSGRVVEVRKAFLDALSRLPRNFPSAAGAVVLVNGKIVGADLFGDPKLFGRLWGKLLDSYIAEAVRREKEESATTASAEDFLQRARQARIELGGSPGVGQQIAMEGEGLKGGGILLATPVHLDLFPLVARAAHSRPSLNRDVLHQQNIAPASSLRH
jgi:hypothetical protein